MQFVNNPGVSSSMPSAAPSMPAAPKMPQSLPQMPQNMPRSAQPGAAAGRFPQNFPPNLRTPNKALPGRSQIPTAAGNAALSRMGQMAKLTKQLDTAPTFSAFDNSPALARKAPEFPESAFERLRNMMESNQQSRDGVSGQLQKTLSGMKEKFFESYSYKTETGPDGKPKLLLDEQGRPQLMQGKENFAQRVARQEHESATKQAYTDFHSNTKESFLGSERQQVMNFLQNHRNELQNPAVQQELQKMLADSQKKGQQLKREQEGQLWELDLPTEEMREVARKELKRLHNMEDEHKKMEDSSAEAHELIMYQEEINAIAVEERKKLQFSEKDEAFLQGMDSLLKPPAEPTLAELLPPYLTEALYNMGIYAIE